MEECWDRVYLPSVEDGIEVSEYLLKYIEREFPQKLEGNVVYSIPKSFNRFGELQASQAEKIVFQRLQSVESDDNLRGLWMIFIHNVSYAGRSHRNQRVGKLMIREHDFVVFARYKDKNYAVLIEVKSTKDSNTNIPEISISSDAKVIKNNKRSAQHQLRDHSEILSSLVEDEKSIQQYIFWPFLGAFTKDPKHTIMKRWKEDNNLHVFENTFAKQEDFNRWFEENIINGSSICDKDFVNLLNRFLILSCGFFVDEIRRGMLGLLTQEQLHLLNSEVCQDGGKPMVVHGAAGSGKTLLIIRKLQQLRETGRLDENNRALYICYWPGIRSDVEEKLKTLQLKPFVDTARFYISQTGFLLRNNTTYKHIFMDEAEVICLVFDEIIFKSIFTKITDNYQSANEDQNWGELWFLLDTNQTSLLHLRQSPTILKEPIISLTKVMRSTENIFKLFQQFYSNPVIMEIGHNVSGPPISWVNLFNHSLIEVIIDLCGTKGFKPNDLCVIPFIASDNYKQDKINSDIADRFVEKAFRPRCTDDVENFVCDGQVDEFLIAWALRVKGLEFKVLIVVIDNDDFDFEDIEDRKKMYIMLSRCTSMLILICSEEYKKEMDSHGTIKNYMFGPNLLINK